ncbi:hypothetical protein [Candidatus Korobacter versatilis]|uniref:hypothetical protein n=1 Tax=Candidatus Korobacter versatilis TaxID=658062 RepID=UPI0002D7793E|nr:hypothetical protein [Candidatus Koribacter versatilis]
MACPFFIPTERLDGAFKFPDRLPLAPGFSGVCGAPGQMLCRPADEELRDHCNLGHASCLRLPKQRHADSVRFSARAEKHKINVRYVYEVECWPAGGGTLEFDDHQHRWLTKIEDDKLQCQAECFLKTWRTRQRPSAAAAHL